MFYEFHASLYEDASISNEMKVRIYEFAQKRKKDLSDIRFKANMLHDTVTDYTADFPYISIVLTISITYYSLDSHLFNLLIKGPIGV